MAHLPEDAEAAAPSTPTGPKPDASGEPSPSPLLEPAQRLPASLAGILCQPVSPSAPAQIGSAAEAAKAAEQAGKGSAEGTKFAANPLVEGLANAVIARKLAQAKGPASDETPQYKANDTKAEDNGKPAATREAEDDDKSTSMPVITASEDVEAPMGDNGKPTAELAAKASEEEVDGEGSGKPAAATAKLAAEVSEQKERQGGQQQACSCHGGQQQKRS